MKINIEENLLFSNFQSEILEVCCAITINIFRIINIMTRLLIKSAFVKTWIAGIEFSTKYLLPTAPKIPPKLSVILVSKYLGSIKKTK